MKKNVIFITAAFLALAMSTGATTTKRRTWNGPATPPPPPKLEDLPMKAVDTLDTKDPDTKIIIYSNNTWTYYRPGLTSRYDDLSIYTQNWDTEQIFAYTGIEIANLPPIIELKLFNNIEDFHYPVTGNLGSIYGPRGRRNHNGVDIPAKVGEPVYATFDGKVRYSKYNTGGFGNLVIIRHPNGLETYYAHLSRANVQSGDYVKAGQVIGYVGNTGRSYGSHLHFEVRYCDHTFDPQYIIDFEKGLPRYQTFALDRSFFNINSRASDLLDEDFEYGFNPMSASLLADSSEESGTILERIEKAQAAREQAAREQAEKAAAAAAKQKSASTSQYYTARKGDTLGGIASKYKTTVSQLCKLNKITTKTILTAGRKLRVR